CQDSQEIFKRCAYSPFMQNPLVLEFEESDVILFDRRVVGANDRVALSLSHNFEKLQDYQAGWTACLCYPLTLCVSAPAACSAKSSNSLKRSSVSCSIGSRGSTARRYARLINLG